MTKTPATAANVLTERQERLVELMASGEHKLLDAIHEAGYASDSSGYKAWRQQHVQNEFIQRVRQQLADDIPLALSVRRQLLSSARSERVKLEAAQDILDRAGLVEDRSGPHGAISVHIDLSGN